MSAKSRSRRTTLRRRLGIQRLDERRLMAADVPLGATPFDTGEFLLGTVAVTPVLFESDGSIDAESQNWTAEEIDAMLAKIDVGLQWWVDSLAEISSVHELNFIVDPTFATTPFETGYEPIDRGSDDYTLYARDFVQARGLGIGQSLDDAMFEFNDSQRRAMGADWAFTIFVADSSDDPDGIFASGGTFGGAFALAGGLYMVVPSMRPASTITHEMGHIFWAFDEYAGGGTYTDHRGYYDTQNLNAADNPTPGFVHRDSIMRGGTPLANAYAAHTSPASTFALVGWQDSDGDGIFDVADVPLDLDVSGFYNAADSRLTVRGNASAVPLRNRNTIGPQSDITLNRIDELQIRVDGGDWIAIDSPGTQTAQFDLSFNVPIVTQSLEIRVIDSSLGITSPIRQIDLASGTIVAPVGIDLLTNLPTANNTAGTASLRFAGTVATLVNADGSPVQSDSIAASSFEQDVIEENQMDAVRLRVVGAIHETEVGVESSQFGVDENGDEVNVFVGYEMFSGDPENKFDEDLALIAEFAVPTASATATLIGVDKNGSYGRIEALDGAGAVIARSTSQKFARGETISLTVTNPAGEIHSVRVLGHASTAVEVAAVTANRSRSAISGDDGRIRLPNTSPGDYRIELLAENIIYDFDPIDVMVDSVDSIQLVQPIATRINSTRFNAANPFDVDGSGGDVASGDAEFGDGVEVLDALLIINSLRRDGVGLIQRGSVGPDIDVNNDGRGEPLDALLVINYLRRRSLSGEQLGGGQLVDGQLVDGQLGGGQLVGGQLGGGQLGDGQLGGGQLGGGQSGGGLSITVTRTILTAAGSFGPAGSRPPADLDDSAVFSDFGSMDTSGVTPSTDTLVGSRLANTSGSVRRDRQADDSKLNDVNDELNGVNDEAIVWLMADLGGTLGFQWNPSPE